MVKQMASGNNTINKGRRCTNRVSQVADNWIAACPLWMGNAILYIYMLYFTYIHTIDPSGAPSSKDAIKNVRIRSVRSVFFVSRVPDLAEYSERPLIWTCVKNGPPLRYIKLIYGYLFCYRSIHTPSANTYSCFARY